MQKLSWDDIRYFLAVEAAGSFSAAAKVLGVEHTTVSRRIAQLEQRLGGPLLLRARDGVRLSAAGAELLPMARAAEERMLAVERALHAPAGHPARVRLATSSMLAGLLAPHVPALISQQPRVALDIRVAHGLVKLTRGEADLALRLRPPGARVAEASVVASVLARIAWAAYVSAKPSQQRAVISFSGSARPGAAWLEPRDPVARRVFVDDVPTALALTRAGVGTAVLPCFLGDADASLRRCSRTLEEHRLMLATPRELRRAEPVRAVAQWLREVTAREKRRLAGEG